MENKSNVGDLAHQKMQYIACHCLNGGLDRGRAHFSLQTVAVEARSAQNGIQFMSQQFRPEVRVFLDRQSETARLQ
jgi:hypothetical protein